jgi:hypothetical protein
MHYKNGTPAQENDHVIGRDYTGKVITGRIFNLRAGETCNCDVAVLAPGSVQVLSCSNVKDFYHAGDAIAAIESLGSQVPVTVASTESASAS